MSEFFKGLFNIRSKDEKQFDQMRETYAKGGTPGHKDVSEALDLIMKNSPDLKARTLEAIREGYVRSYSDIPVNGAGSASYQPNDQSIRIAPKFNHSDWQYMETMFMLGHETEHARSMKGKNDSSMQLAGDIERIARSDGPLPRDYTDAVNGFAERIRAEEGRAHIGGFNAIASYVINDRHPKPGELLRELYETHPGRMGDFIEKSSIGIPATYTLKAGLALEPNGQMAYSQQNIDAMKIHYADKAQLGAPHMNYRQEAIEFASGIIKNTENRLAESRMEDRDYIIDPQRLQAHPALGLPGDGSFQAKGMPEMVHLDLGELGPISIQSSVPQPSPSAPPVELKPQPTDHPLFAQALTAVVELHRADKLTDDPQELRNLAAAVAVAAQSKNLSRIDSVALSPDKTGVFAVENRGEVDFRARAEGLTAMATPEATSLAQLKPVDHAPSPIGQSAPVLGQSSDPNSLKPPHL